MFRAGYIYCPRYKPGPEGKRLPLFDFSAADVCLVINCCEESEEREAYYITSDKGCAVVERLIAKLKALPDDILLSKERSMEYIQKSLRII